MFSPTRLVCRSCEKLFGQHRKPYVGKCDHQLCEECVKDCQKSKKCSVCGDEFSEPVVNYTALELVEHVKKNIFEFYDRVWYEKKMVGIGLCSICKSFSKKLRICLDCGLKNGFLESDDSGSIEFKRTGFNSSLGIFERIHLEAGRFCGNCVLDEKTDHTGHKLMTFEKLVDYAANEITAENINIMLLIVIFTVEEVLEGEDNCDMVQEIGKKMCELADNMWRLLQTNDSKEINDFSKKKRQFEEEKQRHRIIRELETLLNTHCGTKFETKLKARYEDVDDLVEEFENVL